MSSGFNFSIDFDSSAFKRGSDDAADSLDKLGQALDDIATTDTTPAERGVEDIGDAARDAGDGADAMSRQFADAFDKAKRDATDTGDKVEKELERPIELDVDTEGPLTATQDMANEVKASLGETLGELSGVLAEGGASMEDMVDGVVEVSAEAAGALPGPWGLAGQALVAVASAVYGAWKKRQEDIAADASEMYADMLDSGAEFLSNDYFQKKLGEFFDPMGENYDSNMDKIDVLGDLGVPVDEAARALVGYGDLSSEVLSKLYDDTYGANVATAGLGLAYDALGIGTSDVMSGIIKDLADSKESTGRAKDAVRDYRDSIAELPKDVETGVDVDDNGTIRDTQKRINDITGKDVAINVKASTYSAEADLARLTQSYNGRTVYINVQQRRTGGFYK